jgi:hypothetical protein
MQSDPASADNASMSEYRNFGQCSNCPAGCGLSKRSASLVRSIQQQQQQQQQPPLGLAVNYRCVQAPAAAATDGDSKVRDDAACLRRQTITK